VIGLLLVAQIGIVANAPDTAGSCIPFEITVAVRAPGMSAPRLTPPAGAGIQLLDQTVTSRLDRDPLGQPTTFTEARYVVAIGATGRMAVPPFVATMGGVSARSAPLVVDVRPLGTLPPIVLVRSSLDAGARSFDSVWVGQQVDYVVDVQLNESARQRLRHNPTFFPPEMPAVLAYDLAPPPPLLRAGRSCFETLSYRRALFPLFPGAVRIAPATLTYSLPLSTSFFAREERFERRTDTVRFVAVEPPRVGRPRDFTGAVGAIEATMRLDAPTGRMGDPAVLTLRLAGAGNVKLFPRPTVSVDWATVALGEERVTVDTSVSRVRGTKEFDWLLTPRRAGRLVVPAIRYPYFDPQRGQYDAALTDSITLPVASADLASGDTASTSRLPIRRRLAEEQRPPLPSQPWYWAALVLAPVPATLRRVLRRRRRRAVAQSAGRRLRTLRDARRPPSPRELRRAFLDALGERAPDLTASGTTGGALARTLRRAGVTDRTAQSAEQLLARLDQAAFSPEGVVDADLPALSAEIAAAVDREAIRRPPGGAATALLAAALLSATAVAMPEAVRRSFDEGVRAYERGELAASQRLFARSAARAPRSADAWANLGVAAWARGDTAHAALGWQRALRLDPLDDETRERLAAVQAPVVTAPSYVPPLPVNLLALAALVLWMLAWLALAIQAVLRAPGVRPVAGGMLVVAIVALAAALELNERSGVRGLGVVRHTRDLLDAPSTEGMSAASAAAGEVGALGVREGTWVRLVLDGARAGWIPVAAVLPLDAPGVD
jgi:tetratricopeptide (TPR) repeat protein